MEAGRTSSTLPGIDTSKLSENQIANLEATQKMNDNGAANSTALLALQRQENQRSEAVAAMSNMMKNAHDSDMLILNNAKG